MRAHLLLSAFIGATTAFAPPPLAPQRVRLHGAGSVAAPQPRFLAASSARRRTLVVREGLFGLGPLEIGVIVAVAALVVGPSQLTSMARDAGKTVGTVSKVPEQFASGLDEGGTSEEVGSFARSLGKGTAGVGGAVKSAAEIGTSLAGEAVTTARDTMEEVRSSSGMKDGVDGIISALEEGNKLVETLPTGKEVARTVVDGVAGKVKEELGPKA